MKALMKLKGIHPKLINHWDWNLPYISCPHAPIVAEIKFASPSRGVIVPADANAASQIATTMISAGAVGLSVLTQPFLFNGSIETLSMVRKVSTVPVPMKDILVSEVQIDAAKSIGADYILLIKTILINTWLRGA